jgi:hypothetical protein
MPAVTTKTSAKIIAICFIIVVASSATNVARTGKFRDCHHDLELLRQRSAKRVRASVVESDEGRACSQKKATKLVA